MIMVSEESDELRVSDCIMLTGVTNWKVNLTTMSMIMVSEESDELRGSDYNVDRDDSKQNIKFNCLFSLN